MKKGPLYHAVKAMLPQYAAAAQRVLDAWHQDDEGVDEELGTGGVCDAVTRAIEDVADLDYENSHGDPGEPFSIEGGQPGDEHSFLIFYDDDEAVVVDLPAEVYETGGGYRWKKRRGVKIKPSDFIVEPMKRSDLGNDPQENPPRVHRAQRVVAILKKDAAISFSPGTTLNSPEDVIAAMSDYIGGRANEMFVALFLDARNKVIGYTEMTSGSMSSVEIHPVGIFREAMLAGAIGVVTVHQHPSGNAEPSSEDKLLWRRLRAAGELLGVPVVDNMVIGEKLYYSESQNSESPIPKGLRP